MRTAVTIPDDVFARAEALAKRSGRSRSEVYSAALREYLARHAPGDVTEALDRVAMEVGEGEQAIEFNRVAARRILETSKW